MKKMIVVYILQMALIGSVLFTLKRLTQHLALIEQQLASMPKAATGRGTRGEPILRVFVVNEPAVSVNGTVAVRVEGEPLDVKVTNPSYDPVPVEIER